MDYKAKEFQIKKIRQFIRSRADEYNAHEAQKAAEESKQDDDYRMLHQIEHNTFADNILSPASESDSDAEPPSFADKQNEIAVLRRKLSLVNKAGRGAMEMTQWMTNTLKVWKQIGTIDVKKLQEMQQQVEQKLDEQMEENRKQQRECSVRMLQQQVSGIDINHTVAKTRKPQASGLFVS